jgi:hypothetical protein
MGGLFMGRRFDPKIDKGASTKNKKAKAEQKQTSANKDIKYNTVQLSSHK